MKMTQINTIINNNKYIFKNITNSIKKEKYKNNVIKND